jgi:hypothetical protein
VTNNSKHSKRVRRGPQIKAKVDKTFTKIKLLSDLALSLFEVVDDLLSNSIATGRKEAC